MVATRRRRLLRSTTLWLCVLVRGGTAAVVRRGRQHRMHRPHPNLRSACLCRLLPVPAIRAAGAWILRCGLSWGDGQAAAAAPAAADPADA